MDGHERPDVVKYRGDFLKQMTSLGFLNTSNAPSEEAATLLPAVEVSSDCEQTIYWFHDESSYNANDDQSIMWKDESMQIIKPKGKGAGLMVSDFIEERDGFLALSDEMYETLSKEDQTLKQSARVIFEYGKAKEGYWDCHLFMEQMEVAVKVAEAKYPPHIYKHVWIFDHSCGHTAFAPDALVASHLNKKPGGKQPAMRDTVWAGKLQRLVMDDGTPKGAAMILEERGINKRSLTLDDMKTILSQHDDFWEEKNALNTFLKPKATSLFFSPNSIV